MGNKPIPTAHYQCGGMCEYTWPAEDLSWSETRKDWICDNCWEEVHCESIDDEIPEFGVSLADEIKAQELVPPVVQAVE